MAKVRLPRQRRSRETADAIVEAAARVFAEDGLEKATTNRIAEIAGVSVGSLYQYFPSKHALLTALFARESARAQEMFVRIVADHGIGDVPRIVRTYTDATLRLFEENAPLYRMLLEEVPKFAGLEPTHVIDANAATALSIVLTMAKSRLSIEDVPSAAKLIVRAFRYNTLAIIREPLDARARRAFIDEMTAMICNYLFGPRPPLSH
jgi:AcrR family transcriptional regulator